MKILRYGVAVLLMALTFAPEASLATGDTCVAPCPPKYATAKVTRSVSASAIPCPPIGTPLLSATLKKASKKRILVVEAMLTTGGWGNPAPDFYHLDLTVNGVFVGEPTLANPLGVPEDCGLTVGVPDFECTVNAQWWVDIDTAEAAFPGLFVNLPITATLLGGSVSGSGNPIDVEMTMHLEKK